MMGEPVGEGRGRVTNVRVMPFEGQEPRVEVSFQSMGKVLGIEVTEMGTYVSTMRADGTMFGSGQGVLMTKDGESLTWQGQGVGRRKGKGPAASWRGAIYYQSASRNFTRLNGIATLFEFDTDDEGNTQSKLFEWK